MISNTSFTGLELTKKENLVDHDPIYEDVSGFEPLRNISKNDQKFQNLGNFKRLIHWYKT